MDIVELVTSSQYGPGTNAANSMENRIATYDTCSVQDAMAHARAMMYALEHNEEVHDLPITVDALPDIDPLYGIVAGPEVENGSNDNGSHDDDDDNDSNPEGDV